MTPNTYWRPIFWEPVSGTGERLMIGVVMERDSVVRVHRIIRDDVLDSLYGKASQGAKRLIDTGLMALKNVAEAASLREEMPDTFGLRPGALRHTYAESAGEALRTAALLYSSLSNLDKLDDLEETDAPSQEETNKRFLTEVKEAAIALRPDISNYFGKQAILLDGGEPIRFGFCSPNAIVHFGVLSPIRQSASLRDARARLWELMRAKEFAQIKTAALIFATPREDDPTLSRKQVDSVKRNISEIEREADTYKMRFDPVTSVHQGVERVLAYA